jgi:hypothetical protein
MKGGWGQAASSCPCSWLIQIQRITWVTAEWCAGVVLTVGKSQLQHRHVQICQLLPDTIRWCAVTPSLYCCGSCAFWHVGFSARPLGRPQGMSSMHNRHHHQHCCGTHGCVTGVWSLLDGVLRTVGILCFRCLAANICHVLCLPDRVRGRKRACICYSRC